MNTAASENRILFLDNLRYLMIVFVVLLHAAASYTSMGRYWAVNDATGSTLFFDITSLIIDIFSMPMLFFIAGYFALPDIRKKGPLIFLKDKFIRLGIPCLIGVTFLVPIIIYIYQYAHPESQPLISYGQLWINWIKSAAQLRTIILYPDVITFNHSAYWFISLLLFFFIVFGIVYALKKHFFPSSASLEKIQTGKAMLFVILIAAVLTMIFRFVSALIPSPYPNPWVIIVSLLQFQAWRIATYIIYFVAGIYAFSRNWFIKENNIPGHPLAWITICIIFCFGYLAVFKSYISNTANSELLFLSGLVGSFLRCFFIILFLNFAFRYWNRPSKINQSLAANSYNIYLVHLPIVAILQLLLVNLIGTPSLIKFGIVSVVSFLMSYIISRHIVKPYPRLSIALVVVMFLLMVIFVHP